MLIAAPGPGITDYIKFYHEKDKHDQLALSYGALVLPESKFLWIEAFTYGGEPTNYKEWCSSLRECDAIINCHLFHVIGKRNFQENAKKFLLMTPMYEPVFPMPNIQLNPTIVLFYGENWRSKDSAKLIIQTYIDREYYKKALLNLRGSMLRCISLAFSMGYDEIVIAGADPETNRYFFQEEEGLDLIDPEIINRLRYYLSEVIERENYILQGSTEHATEISNKVSLRCIKYFISYARYKGLKFPKIKYYGSSTRWRQIAKLTE